MAKKILILDDDADILSICTYILEEQGWDIHTSSNCNDILNMVRKIRPDVILMDNWIPDTGGIVATQLLKSDPDLKNIPVIYFSANHDIKNLSSEAGADTYLAKPFDINDFEMVIASVINESGSRN